MAVYSLGSPLQSSRHLVPCTSVSDRLQRAPFLPSVTLKEGYLHKRKTEGPQLLTRFTFKKRYFWLNSENLSYAKSPDWQVGPRVRRVSRIDRMCIEVKDRNGVRRGRERMCRKLKDRNGVRREKRNVHRGEK